jgi:hypothetical protein
VVFHLKIGYSQAVHPFPTILNPENQGTYGKGFTHIWDQTMGVFNVWGIKKGSMVLRLVHA